MRTPRKVTAREENFRLIQEEGSPFHRIKRDAVAPEPVGTLLLVPMRVVGYDPDCDGSLMARLEILSLDQLDEELDSDIVAASAEQARRYGVLTNCGLSPKAGLVVTVEEVRALLAAEGIEIAS